MKKSLIKVVCILTFICLASIGCGKQETTTKSIGTEETTESSSFFDVAVTEVETSPEPEPEISDAAAAEYMIVFDQDLPKVETPVYVEPVEITEPLYTEEPVEVMEPVFVEPVEEIYIPEPEPVAPIEEEIIVTEEETPIEVAIEEEIIIENTSPREYEPGYFKKMGVLNWGGWRWTYYSQRVLPGGGLNIPGRHVDADGYVCDENEYICLASSTLAKGTVVDTPLGKQGKIYDCGCAANTLDVYCDW